MSRFFLVLPGGGGCEPFFLEAGVVSLFFLVGGEVVSPFFLEAGVVSRLFFVGGGGGRL